MSTGLIFSDAFLKHCTGSRHPERPERLRAIAARLRDDQLWDRFLHLGFAAVDEALLEHVHERAYIERIVRTCEGLEPQEIGFIDTPDSVVCSESAAVAKLAAGGAIVAVDAVMIGRVNSAFAALRPPGHHAERDRSMGFCLFNNIALAAQRLTADYGLERVAIVDFDVHHGNGTQHLFECRRDVLFVSIHEDPRYLYPGTGYANERGIDEGEGFTLNVPLDSGGGDKEYLRAMDELVLPRLREYAPQFVLVSAGFDAAAADPLSRMEVSAEGFEEMTLRLVEFAQECCDGRLVSMLEGGYDLEALANSVSRHCRVLLRSS